LYHRIILAPDSKASLRLSYLQVFYRAGAICVGEARPNLASLQVFVVTLIGRTDGTHSPSSRHVDFSEITFVASTRANAIQNEVRDHLELITIRDA